MQESNAPQTLAANHPLQKAELTILAYEKNLQVMGDRLHQSEILVPALTKEVSALNAKVKALKKELTRCNKRACKRKKQVRKLLDVAKFWTEESALLSYDRFDHEDGDSYAIVEENGRMSFLSEFEAKSIVMGLTELLFGGGHANPED